MKVSIIEPVGGHGGMDYYDYGLARGLVNSDVEVVLHTCEKTAPDPQLAVSGRFKLIYSYVGVFSKAAPWLRAFRYVRGSFASVARAFFCGNKIVHFHFFHVSLLEFFNIIIARLFFRSIIVTAHDVESFASGVEVPILSRWAYSLSHGVVAHNSISRSELIRKLGISEEKIFVIPHGNYVSDVRVLDQASDTEVKLGVPEGKKVVLFFGQIKDVKGLDILLQAIGSVRSELDNICLVVAGRPWKSDFLKYENMIESLNISDLCVRHIRYIPDEHVPYYYRAADLVVLPYKRIYQSGVVLMAMSYGRPVLVSDLPGMTEIVKDGENGFVFRLEEPGSLARKLIEIFNDPERMQTVGKVGRDYVVEKHDWGRIGMLTKAMYQKVLSGQV